MLRRAVGIGGTVVMLAAAVVVVPQRGKADSTKDVLVVNAPSQPVPVSLAGGTGTASVNVANQPTVNLASGTSVGINGAPSVTVTNQPTVNLAPGTVVGVRNANALQPVRQKVVVPLADGQDLNTLNAFTVPAGKRFVLEDLSGSALLPSGQKLEEVELGLGDGPNTFVSVVPTLSGPDAISALDDFEFGRLARAYVEPGNTAYVRVGRSSTSGDGQAIVNVMGYLVDL